MWANESRDLYSPRLETIADVICFYNSHTKKEVFEVSKPDDKELSHNYGSYNNINMQKVATGKITRITKTDENGHVKYLLNTKPNN